MHCARLTHVVLVVVGLVALSACDYKRKLDTLVLQGQQEAMTTVRIPRPHHNAGWFLKLKMSDGASADQDKGSSRFTAYLRNEDSVPLRFTTVWNFDSIAPGQEVQIFNGSISDLSKHNALASPPWAFGEDRKVNVRLRFKPAFPAGEKHTLHISVVASDPLP